MSYKMMAKSVEKSGKRKILQIIHNFTSNLQDDAYIVCLVLLLA